MRIEIEESALDSIKAMAQRLQEERDEFLLLFRRFLDCREEAKTIDDCLPGVCDRAWDSIFERMEKIEFEAQNLIDRCNSSPKVME